ncbi:helix-turn-helix transcriptional regulator [Ruegeria sp. ANG10]|uniref:helix-turn-helix domain-containing protein n=1 Tax=Ruegeria sp. ANG10 TaxID=3042467 RepID=UPI003455A166
MAEQSEIRAFGLRVRELRKAKDLSQETFAHLVDLDRTYIGGIERGERNPGLKTIIKIANGLNVRIVQLFQAD